MIQIHQMDKINTLTRRVIPCLDILDGRVVKGRKFRDLVDVGDPVELAARYSDQGADELVLLDISAYLEGREPFYPIVEKIASRVAIPLTVGGGIRSVDQIVRMLRAGADKASLNSILIQDPDLASRAAARVGSQAVVAAIDAKRVNLTEAKRERLADAKRERLTDAKRESVTGARWQIYVKSGTEATQLDALEWAENLVARGAGELLVTSMDRDGTKEGYDVELLAALRGRVRVPIIASGGAGNIAHMVAALGTGQADAVLAASLFHFNEITVPELKLKLRHEGIPVRL